MKIELVKVRLCLDCAKKLYYHKILEKSRLMQEEETSNRKRRRREKKEKKEKKKEKKESKKKSKRDKKTKKTKGVNSNSKSSSRDPASDSSDCNSDDSEDSEEEGCARGGEVAGASSGEFKSESNLSSHDELVLFMQYKGRTSSSSSSRDDTTLPSAAAKEEEVYISLAEAKSAENFDPSDSGASSGDIFSSLLV